MSNNLVIGTFIHEAVTNSEDCCITSESNGKAYATGTIQDLEVKNRNGRMYMKKDMEEEIKGERLTELIKAKQLRGHAGHPSQMDLNIQSVIDPKLVCVQFDCVWIDGMDIKANFHGTNNEYGKAFNMDLLEGCKPAFSLRALGSIERDRAGNCIVRNPRIITWDHVIFPSHKRAYTSKLIDSSMASKPITEGASISEGAKTYNDYYNQCLITESAATDGTMLLMTNKDIMKQHVAEQALSYARSQSSNVKTMLENFDLQYESAILTNDCKNILVKMKTGDSIAIQLEQYIRSEIMNYCNK